MSGVGIICFAASYAVALLSELSRFFLKTPIRGFFAFGWTLAGFVAHSAYLYYHHVGSVGSIGEAESFFFLTAWALVLANIYLLCFYPRIPFGLVLLPIVLFLIGGAFLAGSTTEVSQPSIEVAFLLKRIHTVSFLLATLGVSIGFGSGVMFLVQHRRLRRKTISESSFKLPTLEWSLIACRHAIGASLVFLGTCIFSGVLLHPKLFFLGDPLVLGSLAMFGFLLLFSGILSAKFGKQEGRRIAVLTLISFLFLVTILLFGLFYRNTHWKKTTSLNEPRPVVAGYEPGSAIPVFGEAP